MGNARLHEAPFLLVEDMFDEHRVQLLERRVRVFFLGDPAAHSDHVRQRPVGHALSVGETAAAMPVGDERQIRRCI